MRRTSLATTTRSAIQVPASPSRQISVANLTAPGLEGLGPMRLAALVAALRRVVKVSQPATADTGASTPSSSAGPVPDVEVGVIGFRSTPRTALPDPAEAFVCGQRGA